MAPFQMNTWGPPSLVSFSNILLPEDFSYPKTEPLMHNVVNLKSLFLPVYPPFMVFTPTFKIRQETCINCSADPGMQLLPNSFQGMEFSGVS